MLESIIAFLVMLNPFALFLYLKPIMEELNNKKFLSVFFKASLISYAIFVIFMAGSDFLFQKVFQISFEAFRIFGGIVIFSFAYHFIAKGEQAFVQMKEDLDDLASEIALPFMVGAGTISLSALMGYKQTFTEGLLTLFIILSLNFIIVVGLKTFKDNIKYNRVKIAFDKNMEIMLRLAGFFLGAIGINMIVSGIKAFFF